GNSSHMQICVPDLVWSTLMRKFKLSHYQSQLNEWLARLESFPEFRVCNSDTSPAVPKRNPSCSDLSESHDRGCYRKESLRRDCSARRSRSVSRPCAECCIDQHDVFLFRGWVEEVAYHIDFAAQLRNQIMH